MKNWNRERAKELVKTKGYTREFIASQCGIKLSSLYQILQGGRSPGGSLLILLAQMLSTNVDYLTGKSDDPRPSKEAA